MSGAILTANELNSGATVYLAASGEWLKDIDLARVFSEAEADERAALAEKARDDHRLIGVEVEAASVDGGQVIAQRLREQIRAGGPTSPRQGPQPLAEGDHVSL